MNKYFENKLSYQGLSVYFGNNPKFSEREIHTYNEVMFYMDDDTLFLTENGQKTLKSNTLLVVPKETYHFIKSPENKSFLRIKISIPDAIINKTPIKDFFTQIITIEDLNENIISILTKLQQILKENTEKNAYYAYSLVLLLLCELSCDTKSQNSIKLSQEKGVISFLLSYISNHLAEDLTIDVLSNEINYSKSSISHLFKKEVGVSLHKFITMRRMIHARNLIKDNEKISNVHLLCGYQDYSSFYKAYLKYFGYPPSSEK